MLKLRSLLFDGLVYPWTSIPSVVALPLVLLPSSYLVRMIHFWTRSVIGLLGVVVGLRYQVRGMENLPDGAVIIASKHQSAWETLALWCVLRQPAYILKRELCWIPVWGWMIPKAGMIPVDRAGGVRALRRMVERAREIAAQERPIVIFPEGTRVAPGVTGDFHPGIAALYTGLALPVVPVALNSGLFWPRRRHQRPGTITMEFLPPLQPGSPRKTFMAELRAAIAEATTRLESEEKHRSAAGMASEQAAQASVR